VSELHGISLQLKGDGIARYLDCHGSVNWIVFIDSANLISTVIIDTMLLQLRTVGRASGQWLALGFCGAEFPLHHLTQIPSLAGPPVLAD
jgi:hypothetical protein